MRKRYRLPEPVPMPPLAEMGPSRSYLQKATWQQEVVDDLDEDVAQLVWDYGFDRAMAAMRSGTIKQARKICEEQRGPPVRKRT